MLLTNPTFRQGEVTLRPLRRDDLPDFQAYALAESDTWYYSPVQPNTPSAMAQYVEDALTAQAAGTAFPFTVVVGADEVIAGSTRLYDYEPQHRCGKLGYTWYGQRFRGSGLNTVCKALLLRWCFEDLGLERVGFEADAANLRSIRAMEKIGAVREGVLRSHRQMDTGRRRDTIVLSILREEWPSR